MTQVMAENFNSMHVMTKSRLFWVLSLGIVVLATSYAVLVHSAVVNVVEREKITIAIREKATAVSELESTYFSMKNKISIELAHAKGFQASEVTSFISKKSLTAFVPSNEL